MQKDAHITPEHKLKLKAAWAARKKRERFLKDFHESYKDKVAAWEANETATKEALAFFREHSSKLFAYKAAVAFQERYGPKHVSDEERRLKNIFR